MSAAGVLPSLREALSQHDRWRDFSPHQLSLLLFFHSYVEVPPDEHDVAAALPFALQDHDPDEESAA
jgi:hypothetical protein